jgi:hypothetical protein
MIRLLALLLSMLWAAGVAYAALQSWPTLPLDLPARDPQVQAALARAVQNHVIRHTIAASLPLLMFIVALGWQSLRRR